MQQIPDLIKINNQLNKKKWMSWNIITLVQEGLNPVTLRINASTTESSSN